MTRNSQGQQSSGRKVKAAGFSLVELSVAMAVFLVVSITSFTLFSRHQSMLSREQGFAGLNIGLRNALSQIQIDVVNAGVGEILGTDATLWPVGVAILNQNPATACNVPYPPTDPPQYTATCFDQLNVVTVDTATPYLQPTASCSGSGFLTSGATALVGTFPTSFNSTAWTAASTAAQYHTGDQILFEKGNPSGVNFQYTSALLTANGATSGSNVSLSFTPTLTSGANTAGAGSAFPSNAPANDPLSITTNGVVPSSVLTNSYCASDFVLRLIPIEYWVNVSNTADPQLMRTMAGVSSVVMDQVIAFKVGAATWNTALGTSNFDYCYNNALAITAFCDAPNNSINGYASNYTAVRSVRVTIIGRTAPSTDPSYTYRNPFDLGRYQIRGSSIVVDPRNLTMSNH